MSETERTTRETREGVGDEYPAEQAMNEAPGLSGGEYPGAEDVTDEMSDELPPEGDDTTFGGAFGGYGPAGTIGTVEQGNAAGEPPPRADDTQFDLGPERQ